MGTEEAKSTLVFISPHLISSQAKLMTLSDANDKRMQNVRQEEHAEIDQLKREKQQLVDELDGSRSV